MYSSKKEVNMKILFASVIYEGIKDYLNDFIQSLNNQTFKDFDIVIINDGLKNKECIEKIKKINCNILEYSDYGLNPSQIRVKVIKYAIKKEYDLLIFGDSDDTFSINRVNNIKEKYSSEIAFYYNDLIIKDSNTDFFSGKLPIIVDNKNQLDDYNFIGMSNSAINVKKIKNLINKIGDLKECIAFDWYFYTLLLKLDFTGVKVENAETYYRIHDDNIAGFTNKLNPEILIRGIEVKKFQYGALSKIEPLFLEKYKKITMLEYVLRNNKTKMYEYIDYINNEYKYSVFWWENIRLIDKF